MISQKHLFDIPEGITYLNGAYMSPLLKTIAKAGYKGVDSKMHPWELSDTDFFEERALLRQRFAQLIDTPEASYTAIIPSVSYGMANVAHNIDFTSGDEIILIDEQFPSNVYIWQEVAKKNKVVIKTITSPKIEQGRGKKWNQELLNSINQKTKVVAIPQVHWADGTLFDLINIRKACDSYNALLVIDGTQSIGAYPFSIQDIRPDALICGGYKWMLGPYSLGMAYYGDAFHDGKPMEENWMNRLYSEDFSRLVQYQEQYQPGAGRFNMGESSNFILVPMLVKAIEQLLEWTPNAIQDYCFSITKDTIQILTDKGCFIEEETNRSSHLFGVFLPSETNIEDLKIKLKQENIFVSYRGDAIRVSPSIYNSKDDLEKFSKTVLKLL
ncbi:aminotransferase class V-fold PLP-dependent enzyme [Ascidiimonas sp. W6]|uniref:aminotransferase class V-fold PLP-dependent enzyme n=1 Tax=Ascidiimonas meishanensis TaxID=3128903 RepID=UPI0030ECE727